MTAAKENATEIIIKINDVCKYKTEENGGV